MKALSHPARRVAALLTVAVASAAVVVSAAVASHQLAVARHLAGPRATAETLKTQQTATPGLAPAGDAARRPGPQQMATAQPAAPALSVPPTLTAADRESCPATATACVDLTRHITWLQSAGKVIFGPVVAEPGPPGSAHATPRGTFQVSWKAGPGFISNIYHDPMPWAVFFAAGGIAFHGGSLTTPSHGCVHLTTENAHYYNEHLPVGAEVVVF